MSKKKKKEDDRPDYLKQEYYNKHPMEVPEGCAACGGPYPDCKWSCPMFDND